MTPRVKGLERILLMVAARQMWNNGHAIGEIAKAMGRSVSTIRSWIKTTGITNLRRRPE